MFDQMKDMGKLLKQAKDMRSKMKDVQKKLKTVTVSGQDKNGMIEVTLTGELECTSVKILNNSILDLNNISTLEKALVQAFNTAAKTSKTTASKELSSVTGGLNIPGLT
jgi:DNA-binding YbaB/EbfC family protein